MAHTICIEELDKYSVNDSPDRIKATEFPLFKCFSIKLTLLYIISKRPRQPLHTNQFLIFTYSNSNFSMHTSASIAAVLAAASFVATAPIEIHQDDVCNNCLGINTIN